MEGEGGGGGGSVLVRGRLISSTLCYITGAGDIGIFYWVGGGGVKLWFKRDFWTLLWQLNYFSQRQPRVSQSGTPIANRLEFS